MIGKTIGPYQVVAKLGEGGMGEVYLARDTKLNRDVALKVLPDAVANDADRLARFTREAQTLAALNHPNIAHIHGLEESGNLRALVMELVDGEDLSEVIARGPIPLADALPIAHQIAEALEAAHERGIIHRDLKPANVKVRGDGTVKVLDFGLAKAMTQDAGPRTKDLTNSPTLTTPAMTQMGMILGTAAYMSPEQARGRPVDKRADIWAFGAVLYEMLTGRRAFPGDDLTETIANVVKTDPDWGEVPPDLPARVRRVLQVCLDKDPRRRGGDISAIRLALKGVFETETDAASRTDGSPPRSHAWRVTAAAALVSAAAAGLLVWSLVPRPAGDEQTTRFIIRTVGDLPLSAFDLPLALSPNGRDLVYGVGADDQAQLFHQNLDGFEPRAIDGARGAKNPFFSPRGDVIGFYSASARQFQRLALAGGSAARLFEPGTEITVGASWGEDDTLVTSSWGQPLSVVRPGASEAVDLTRLDAGAREESHVWPQILPGNRGVLFTIWSGDPTWDQSELAVADLESGTHTIVLRGGASARYASSGHLVFWRGNALMAVPFDLDTLTTRGEPVRVVTDVRLYQGSGGAHFAISQGGTLAYVQGKQEMFSESFVADSSGQRVINLDAAGGAGDPVFSPDGTRLALTLYRGGAFGVGVFDIARNQVTPVALTRDNVSPGWTSEGDRVTFMSNRDGGYRWYASRFDGSGAPEPLFSEAQGFNLTRSVWSRDGRYLAYGRGGAEGTDVWVLESGTDTGRPLIASPAAESAPTFSPDGRFLAYQSDESGTAEVYVRPFPDVDARRDLISRSGGRRPVWSGNGEHVFYASEEGLMRVPVASVADGVPRFGQPSLVFEMSGIKNFDVSPDGQTFAIERMPIEAMSKEIHVVLNWFEELKRLVPVK